MEKNIFDQNYKNFEKNIYEEKNTVKAISSFLNNIND